MKRIMMACICLLLWQGQLAGAAGVNVSTADGGSVSTEIGYGYALNKKSSLKRLWLVLNDQNCPLQLYGAGIRTKYDDRSYKFEQVGSIAAREPLSAFEIRYVLYDVFGEYLETLSNTEVVDLKTKGSISLSDTGTWVTSEGEVSKMLTVVSFVARVRTASGKIWHCQEKEIVDGLSRNRLKVGKEFIVPTPGKEK